MNHDREAPGLPIDVALIDLLMEVNDAEHFERVREALRREGLSDITLEPPRMNTPPPVAATRIAEHALGQGS